MKLFLSSVLVAVTLISSQLGLATSVAPTTTVVQMTKLGGAKLPENPTVAAGSFVQFDAFTYSTNARGLPDRLIGREKMVWTVSDLTRATIDATTGRFAAKAPGTVIVTGTLTTPGWQREIKKTLKIIQATFPLTISRQGTGGGSIKINDRDIDCPRGCVVDLPALESATLVAAADMDSIFSGLKGVCTSATPSQKSCRITMDGAKSITVGFTALPKLNVSVVGTTGKGTVTTSQPNKTWSDGESGNVAVPTKSITLTAKSQAGSEFAGWTGACTGMASTCTLAMDRDKTVSATFKKAETIWQLTVGVGGLTTYLGSITSNPAGISCSVAANKCSMKVVSGTTVKLTASKNYFLGWDRDGVDCGTGTTCTISVDRKMTVVAQYGKTASPPSPNPPKPNPPKPNPPSNQPDNDGCFSVLPSCVTAIKTHNADTLTVRVKYSCNDKLYTKVCFERKAGLPGTGYSCGSWDVKSGSYQDFPQIAPKNYTGQTEIKYIGVKNDKSSWLCADKVTGWNNPPRF